MAEKNNRAPETAKTAMDDFLLRTGISDPSGEIRQRYLWTDAFAVQACFALAHLTGNDKYRDDAINLVDNVHFILGKHRADNPHSGWISGMDEEVGARHPTAGGLRIGKKLPSRLPQEPINQSLEWDRDGQYFHYLTRWFHALMETFSETGDQQYAQQAAELILAGRKFIHKQNGRIRMFWKMNEDLTAPVVETMGAHDPMEGLICVLWAMDAVPEMVSLLEPMRDDLLSLCRRMDWITDDPLGIGGLMLNAARTSAMSTSDKDLPDPISPLTLYDQSLTGLSIYTDQSWYADRSAGSRLAFRECGLSLGIRVLYGLRGHLNQFNADVNTLEQQLSLAQEIETFWSEGANRSAPTWTEHQDINAVMHASSLLARESPGSFSPQTV